jgi:hypothetical protein
MKRMLAWGPRPFQVVMLSGAQFVLLTLIAMRVYPGGTRFDPQSAGYNFLNNFFSELGYTVTHNGIPNPITAPLFFAALTFAGAGLVTFFLFSLQFFWGTPWLRVLSICGSVSGVISGVAYIGIAFTPANLLPAPHLQFVLLAFRAFLPAVLFYLVAILVNPEYPNRYAGVYLVFGILLAAYIGLITRGPGIDTAQGVMIQATGQKIIVYAAIITVFIQSWGAAKLSQE